MNIGSNSPQQEIGSGLTALSCAPAEGTLKTYKTVKISLKYITESKRRKIQTIVRSYRSAADSDTVGALNILTKTILFLGSVESPRLKIPVSLIST